MIKKALADYCLLIDNHINQIFPDSESDYKQVIKAARYSLLSSGKRIRPIILLEFYKLLGGNIKDALNFAVALEMIHTYSLIHDDLPCMDNDDMRRGKPSCHKMFSEDIALLAGDKLLTTAFLIASETNLPKERVVKAIEVLSSRANGMIDGQVMDLKFEKVKPSEQQVKDTYKLKTGCLISAAAEIGCILAGADENVISLAAQFANNLALAFQIIDDILDVTGDEKLLGKPVGSDEKNQKFTFVTINGIENSKNAAKIYTDEALNALDKLNGDTKLLTRLTKELLIRNY